jgi:hypothetical protein
MGVYVGKRNKSEASREINFFFQLNFIILVNLNYGQYTGYIPKFCANLGGKSYAAEGYVNFIRTWARKLFRAKLQSGNVLCVMTITTDVANFISYLCRAASLCTSYFAFRHALMPLTVSLASVMSRRWTCVFFNSGTGTHEFVSNWVSSSSGINTGMGTSLIRANSEFYFHLLLPGYRKIGFYYCNSFLLQWPSKLNIFLL